jgi:hypothetical protein
LAYCGKGKFSCCNMNFFTVNYSITKWLTRFCFS